MPAQTFIASSAAEAVAHIREQLGAEAVVLNVRQVPAAGLSRLWQKPRIEVTAAVPEPPPTESDHLGDLRREIAALRELVVQPARSVAPSPAREEVPDFSFEPVPDAGGWRIGALLQKLGLLPLHAQRVVERLQLLHGEAPPASFSDELAYAREALAQLWNVPSLTPAQEARPFHVFVGPPGTGKTTALCKWLTQSVLLEGQPARVWRLDGQTANTAERLSMHGEILGVPVERAWDAAIPGGAGEAGFVDLPGVEARDAAALENLRQQLSLWPHAQVHLVLNAAYDTQLLLAQARAWSSLPVSDLVLTHLDEEPRHGKLWNLVLGTKFALRFLGAGQNVPGDFRPASADALLASTFSGKPKDSGGFAPAGHRWQTTC